MRQAKALISLRVCAGWSEPLLVAHTTLLEISCHGSNDEFKDTSGKDSLTEFSGITVAILQSQMFKFYPMGRHIFTDLNVY